MIRTTLGVLVVGFAAYRLARAVAVDSITLPLRSRVYRRAFIGAPSDYLDPHTAVRSRVWAWAYGLVSCPFCVGFWISLGLYALWINVDGARVFVAAVAVAGVQAMLTAREP